MIQYKGKTYVTPNEAAGLLAIHLATIYSWCKNKEVELLDPHKIKGPVTSKYLIEETSLRARHSHVHLDVK